MPGRVNEACAVSPEEAAGRFVECLPAGASVVVALSGGGDSVGLLIALDDAVKSSASGIRLAAVTIDHALRAGSAAEAAAMAEFCAALEIPHLTRRWEGQKPSSGLMDTARQARLRLLVEAAEELGADLLVTAHTLDDQLETVEMRRSRSEPDARGLAGMAPASLYFGNLWVHRPFLQVERAHIRAYLRARGAGWIDDPSNDDPRFERVRLRQRGSFANGPAEISAAGVAREKLAEAAADHLLHHAGSPLPMLFSLEVPADFGDEAFRLAFAALVAVAGGRAHLPARPQIDRALAGLWEDDRPSVSLGRTVIERRAGWLYIGRDRRDLPRLTIAPLASAEWDGRFAIHNPTRLPLTIGPASARVGPEALPPRIARRAISTLPALADPNCGPDLILQPRCAPFETVLPSFDQALAGALYRLTGRTELPPSLALRSKKSDNHMKRGR
jgi:tRNA(Ile)-lysidine synthase